MNLNSFNVAYIYKIGIDFFFFGQNYTISPLSLPTKLVRAISPSSFKKEGN